MVPLQPYPPLPALPPPPRQRPPLQPSTKETSSSTKDSEATNILLELDVLGKWLKESNHRGEQIQDDVIAFGMSKPNETTYLEKQQISRNIRKTIVELDERTKAAFSRIVGGYVWCRDHGHLSSNKLGGGGGGAGGELEESKNSRSSAVRSDEQCQLLAQELDTNMRLLTGRGLVDAVHDPNYNNKPSLAASFEIMRAAEGTTLGYLKESVIGFFDRTR